MGWRQICIFKWLSLVVFYSLPRDILSNFFYYLSKNGQNSRKKSAISSLPHPLFLGGGVGGGGVGV